ncbi:hypothetical protein H7T43_03105 [Peribacillus simplex]|uniref:hypothetical protein n=1 Tax=Peribacillus TaxID=2675229 RepID=UPI002163EE1D|nr:MULTISPECIES: hypothetical protein [Peribacillus]MBX9953896.1 hypothetical protein [Peribacillus simplex]
MSEPNTPIKLLRFSSEYFLPVIDSVEEMFKIEFEIVNKNLLKLSHGKLELYFLKKILEDLKKLNDKKDYFLYK